MQYVTSQMKWDEDANEEHEHDGAAAEDAPEYVEPSFSRNAEWGRRHQAPQNGAAPPARVWRQTALVLW